MLVWHIIYYEFLPFFGLLTLIQLGLGGVIDSVFFLYFYYYYRYFFLFFYLISFFHVHITLIKWLRIMRDRSDMWYTTRKHIVCTHQRYLLSRIDVNCTYIDSLYSRLFNCAFHLSLYSMDLFFADKMFPNSTQVQF